MKKPLGGTGALTSPERVRADYWAFFLAAIARVKPDAIDELENEISRADTPRPKPKPEPKPRARPREPVLTIDTRQPREVRFDDLVAEHNAMSSGERAEAEKAAQEAIATVMREVEALTRTTVERFEWWLRWHRCADRWLYSTGVVELSVLNEPLGGAIEYLVGGRNSEGSGREFSFPRDLPALRELFASSADTRLLTRARSELKRQVRGKLVEALNESGLEKLRDIDVDRALAVLAGRLARDDSDLEPMARLAAFEMSEALEPFDPLAETAKDFGERAKEHAQSVASFAQKVGALQKPRQVRSERAGARPNIERDAQWTAERLLLGLTYGAIAQSAVALVYDDAARNAVNRFCEQLGIEQRNRT